MMRFRLRGGPSLPGARKIGFATQSCVLLLSAVLLAPGCAKDHAADVAALRWIELETPASAGSATPRLAAHDGRVLLSWTEPAVDPAPGGPAQRTALRYAVLDASAEGGTPRWSAARTVATGDDWFVNWADTPSVTAHPEGPLCAHWLRKNGTGPYAYEVCVSFSEDGRAWTDPIVPHRDGTASEHGFVSVLPWSDANFLLAWLDGRETEAARTATAVDSPEDSEGERHGEGQGGAPGGGPGGGGRMTLRSAVVSANGSLADELEVDPRVCDCCSTSLARTSDGALLVYRDRDAQEIRDISVARFDGAGWSSPEAVHRDRWEIPGCPVNGPAVAADSGEAVVAWYTAAFDTPTVQLARSEDGGATFDRPVRIDDGRPIGRVDVEVLPGGDAIVVWMEATEEGADVRIRAVAPGGRVGPAHTVATTGADRSSGFPRLVVSDGLVVVAWTESGDSTRLRAVVARLGS